MDPLTLMAIGGGLGLGKSLLFDGPKEARQRKLAAETQRYSPWTHLQAQPVQEADPLGSSMQGGFTGAALGQGMQSQESQQDLNNAMADYYRKGAAPASGNSWSLLKRPQNNFWGLNSAE